MLLPFVQIIYNMKIIKIKFLRFLAINVIRFLSFVYSIELPEEIYDICPYSNICNRTAKSTLDAEGLVPCCSSCSCDEDCGLHLNCCFDHLDKYKLVENEKVACVNTRISYENDNNVLDDVRHSYIMVTTCAQDTTNNQEQRTSSNKCHISDAFGNSLLAPVSSRDTDQIYVNEECANCNKVSSNRIKKWNYLLSSEFIGTQIETTITFDIEQIVKNNLGVIIYTPPAKENWSHKGCVGKYIEVESCTKNEIWYELCTNLQLPFRSLFYLSVGIYKNVFCELCSGKQIETVDKDCKVIPNRGPPSQALTVLLDSEVLESTEFVYPVTDVKNAKSGNTCPSGYINHQSKCLVIYCPEGMINTQKRCSYFALRWYIPEMVMRVKLIPTRGVRLHVSQLKAQEGVDLFSWLQIPCQKLKLTSIEVFYSNTVDNEYGNDSVNYVSSFVIRIRKSVNMTLGIDPSSTIPVFYKCVRESWVALIRNETFRLHPYFDKYNWKIAQGKQVLQKWPANRKQSHLHKARPIEYQFLSESKRGQSGPRRKRLALKKPFFCKQVRIPQFDVEVRFGEIHIISNNITLGTNEYLVNVPISGTDPTQREWNKTTFSVCVKDFDPSFTERSERSESAHLAKSPVLTVVFFLYIFSII